MIDSLKRILVGQPLSTEEQQHQRLRKIVALAVFASDPISSNAYATEAIMLVLMTAGAAALTLSIPIAIAIITLLMIVGFSYRQTIHAYPSGGGAYIVAHENLGELPGLVAAGALLIDYVLTVAVSVAAGVFAITSLASTWGYPHLADYRVEISLACIAIITVLGRLHCADRRRGDLQRRAGLSATGIQECRDNPACNADDLGHDLSGDHRAGALHRRRPA